jgi:hypothetical protein
MAWALTSFMRSKSSLAAGRLPLASAILTGLEAPCPRAFGGFLLQRVSQRTQKWWCMKKYQVAFWHGQWPSPSCNPLSIGCENHMVFRNKLLAKAQIPWTKMVIRGLNEDGRCQWSLGNCCNSARCACNSVPYSYSSAPYTSMP